MDIIILICHCHRENYHGHRCNHYHGYCGRFQLRIHLCWGNWHGPHHHDIPIEKIFKVVASSYPGYDPDDCYDYYDYYDPDDCYDYKMRKSEVV